jgi:hypothetical protein
MNLRTHTVIYTEPAEGIFWQFFQCEAEAADHAEEQCRSAYPTGEILWVNEGTARDMT